MLGKTLESPLDFKETQPVHSKGNRFWIFIGRTDAEVPILWLPDAKNCFIWKDPDARKDWGQEEKGEIEEEIVGWHHRLDGHELEQAPGSLAYCSPWGHRVRHDWATEMNLTEVFLLFSHYYKCFIFFQISNIITGI